MLLSETETGAKAGADAAANAAIPKRMQTDRQTDRFSRTGCKRAAAGGMCPGEATRQRKAHRQPVHHGESYLSKTKRVERKRS